MDREAKLVRAAEGWGDRSQVPRELPPIRRQDFCKTTFAHAPELPSAIFGVIYRRSIHMPALSMDQQQNALEFLVVDRVEGGITDDGQAVLMTITTVEQNAVRLCVHASDLERFVTFLLRMAQHGRAAPPSDDRVQYQPIPL